MATKKNEEVINLCNENDKDTVKIRLPLIPGQKQEALYVGCNSRSWVIPRGKTVLIPACAAEIIEHMENEIIAADEYRNSIGMA